ncbi:MAG TPA: hypothetical protein VIY29_24025 [Ktedonobacteraceae bacterium]
MRRTHVTEQTIDPVIGRRIFTLCWFCAGLGVSILQMQLLAQAWSVSRQALAPACIVSAWVLGSLFGTRLRNMTLRWGGVLLAYTLIWFIGTRLVSWRIGLIPTTWLSEGALIMSSVLLGAISTAWLVEPRPWPAVGERAALARGLLGTTTGLFTVWVLPAWAGLIALACLIPLLVLDGRPTARSPLPPLGSVVENWVGRYWNPEGFQVQLEVRSLPRTWWCSYLATRAQDSKGYIPLTLLASGSAVILGAIWGAVPTPFAAGLAGTHELGKLGWLLGGQIVALAIGACCVLVARNVVGFPDRVVPPSWQVRAMFVALSMLVILAGSLVTLGLPFLQAPWWLAFSLASYTLAGAIWGLLLPRLRPSFTTLAVAQRHRRLGQDRGMTEPLHLAHGRAQEERLTRFFAITEGMLIAVCTPVVGLLIDLYGSVDRVLVIIGLSFLLGLTLLALVSVLRSLKHSQHMQFARSAMRDRPTHSWRPGYSLVRPGLAW